MNECKLENKIYRIYLIEIDYKIYVGLTSKSIEARKLAHIMRCFSQNIKERNSCPKLYNKIRKIYSSKEDAIERCPIFEIVNTKCLHCAKECEKFLTLEQYNSVVLGLNSIPGGIYNPMIGRKLSEEHKRKISLANRGRIVSEKTKKRLSDVNIGKKLSEIHRKKLSESHKGQVSAMKGKYHTEKTKQQISKTLSGKEQTIETINKRKVSLPKGSTHHNSKLTENKVIKIKSLIKEGVPFKSIAIEFSIDSSTVSDIKRGKTWSWLP